jgi:DNA-binding response OmpR family regulator
MFRCAHSKRGGGTIVAANPAVLLVEDDPSVRNALVRLLDRDGLCTLGVASLAEARDALVRHRSTLEVLIVDLGLGEEDGLDLVHENRQAKLPLPILIFSAAADSPAVLESLSLGVHEVLLKPAPPTAILAAVRRVIADGGPGMAGGRLRTHPSRGDHRTS